MTVVDLGCGTGLCGALFRPIASKLVGIDLAPRMIAKARSRGVYEELLAEDVVTAMRRCVAEVDLVLAADVFIYIGDLAGVFGAVRACLRPGGLFAFTVESAEDAEGDYVLRRTRRYAHSLPYLRRLASASGFEEVSASPEVLRAGESGDVRGLVVVLRRPTA